MAKRPPRRRPVHERTDVHGDRAGRKLTHWPLYLAWRRGRAAPPRRRPAATARRAPEGAPKRFVRDVEDVACPYCRDYAEATGGAVRLLTAAAGGGVIDLSRCVRSGAGTRRRKLPAQGRLPGGDTEAA